MKKSPGVRWLSVIVLAVALTVGAQSPDQVTELVGKVNRERVTRNLAPYAVSAQLTSAAQAHASDIARTGQFSHTGSDGSTVFNRVARTGYGAFSWGRRVGENWAWYHDPATAMSMWMGSKPHRDNILHLLYREIGVGVAPFAKGGYVYVLVFGAQPNVLPVFLDDGAATTKTANVRLSLSDELVAPGGDGPGTIGHPVEMQVANSSDFSGAKWQVYAAKLPWTLGPGGGTKTVYVKFKDARGRTTTSSDSIAMGGETAALKSVTQPSATATRPRRPTATATIKPRPSATRTPAPPTATQEPATPAAVALEPTRGSVSPTPREPKGIEVVALVPKEPVATLAVDVESAHSAASSSAGALALFDLAAGGVLVVALAVGALALLKRSRR